MKIFGVTLFLVGFAVMSDPAASATNGLWNGGKITDDCEQYIPGKLEELTVLPLS